MSTLVEVLQVTASTWRRAPSAHNTQPWLVEADRDEVVVRWRPERELPAADPDRRDLWLGLGGFVEILATCLSEAALAPRVMIRIDPARHTFARIRTNPDPDRAPAHVLPATTDIFPTTDDIRARRSHRGPMAGEVGDDLLARTSDLAGVARDMIVTLPGDAVPRALLTADRWLFDEPPVTREMAAWLRLSRRHPDYRRDGLTDRALALARWEALGLGIAVRPGIVDLLRRVGATSLLARAAAIDGMGTVVAMTGPADPSADEVAEHGRLLVRWWLAAARHGLVTHPLSQLLDCPRTAPMVGFLVGPRRRPLAVFRVGVPGAPPVVSARLPTDAVLA